MSTSSTPTLNAGRRLDRDRALARARVYRHPPDPDNPKITTAKTAEAIRNRDEAMKQALEWGGGEGRGTRNRWEPGATHEVGDRILSPDVPGLALKCTWAGKSDGKPIDPKDLKHGEEILDGTVTWEVIRGWTGRVGYGSLGMREFSRAMRAAGLTQPPVPGQENAERRRRNRAKAVRQAIRLAADKSRIRRGASRTGPDTDWRTKKASAMAERSRTT